MVTKAFTSILYCLVLGWVSAVFALGNVNVSAEMDQYTLFDGMPLNGTVIVTHEINDPVDTGTFQMDGKPLQVVLAKTTMMGSQGKVEVAIYKFQLPPKTQGLYMLSPISVKVGGQPFSSIASSYTVSGVSLAADIPAAPATLNLQAKVQGPSPVYPGQRLHFIYRFFFQGMIELTEEQLSLFKANGFLKIGDEQAKDYQQGQVSVTEVTQEVEAQTPGDFPIPASSIAGYAYKESPVSKTHQLIEPKLTAETPSMTITVKPFPADGKPDSFNGAVGKFSMRTSLQTPSSMHVDDKIELLVEITGDDNLQTVKLPDLTAAGFRDLFRMPDLAPARDVKDKTVRFLIELHPLSTAVKQIPPITFSYFNPEKGSYETVTSNPIAITVTEAPQVQPPPPPPPVPEPIQPPVEQPPAPPLAPPPPLPPVPKAEKAPPEIIKPAPVEIDTNLPLTDTDLSSRPFGTWNVFWIIPVGILLVLGQMALKRYLAKQRQRIHVKSSQELFDDAKGAFDTREFYPLLNQALLRLLVERGELTSADVTPDQLPEKGFAGNVRRYLLDLEARRFAGKGELNREQLLAEAQKLFNEGHSDETAI